MAKKELYDNPRFYVLLTSCLLCVLVAASTYSIVGPGQLYYIRLSQIFGFMSIAYLYLALIISPLTKVIGEQRSFSKRIVFLRRGIGVSAALFALLHAVVASSGPLGGISGILLLGAFFQVALAFGFVALLVLLAMAATSFDRVIDIMTLPRWKALHRLVYGASIGIILHVWMIGTHLVYPWVRYTVMAFLVLFIVLEAIRIGRKKQPGIKRALVIGVIIGTAVGALLVLPHTVRNFHSAHHKLDATNGGQHGNH